MMADHPTLRRYNDEPKRGREEVATQHPQQGIRVVDR